jgi:sugar lactone lactonase YvrE
VNASTQFITTVAGTGAPGYSGDGGLGTNAELNLPARATFDRDLNLYIADSDNERVRRVNSVTDVIVTIAGNGAAGFSGDGGPATSAELNFPNGEAIDGNGDLFIADSLNNRVRKLTVATGVITTVAGDGASGYSGDGGVATSAELSFPSRPFIDSNENIYIADYGNNRVRRVDANTGVITTIAGNGTAGYSGDGGAATSAELNGPLSIVIDSSGVLYIAEVNNSRIRAVNTTSNPITALGVTIQPGQIETVVGTGVVGYAGNAGPATGAKIDFPTGLSVDSYGNLFFADSHNNVVRKVIGGGK